MNKNNAYRRLYKAEIKRLVKQGNSSENWQWMEVANGFDAKKVHHCVFFGSIKIGHFSVEKSRADGLSLQTGLYHSTISDCELGNNVAIHHVGSLSRFVIHDHSLLFHVQQMTVSLSATFGNGDFKLLVRNEHGGREIQVIEEMTAADAFIWSSHRNNKLLQNRLHFMTKNACEKHRFTRGDVGEHAVITGCRYIHDVRFGPYATVSGADCLKNLTIRSQKAAPTVIDGPVTLVDGIVDYGCRVLHDSKAFRFYLRSNSSLLLGARILDTILGDNSTVACCELLNSLVFPGHEQHHNNSFLCSSVLQGQSNIAAGATIGSNHNSRVNDGELVAGRGFWPGLCVSLTYPSRFATFCLIAKGAYPYKLNISLPFSLVANNEKENRLHITPGFGLLHNLYALQRHKTKYRKRDRHLYENHTFEYDFLAPDTIDEMWAGITYIKNLVATETAEPLSAPKYVMEASDRRVVLLRATDALSIYRKAIHLYCIKTILTTLSETSLGTPLDLAQSEQTTERQTWVNVGGQLMTQGDYSRLITDIKTETISTWDDLHKKYGQISAQYPKEKMTHAFKMLLELTGTEAGRIDRDTWSGWLQSAEVIQDTFFTRTEKSRKKDYTDKFRQMTYDSQGEMIAVVGDINADSVIEEVRIETAAFKQLVKTWLSKL